LKIIERHFLIKHKEVLASSSWATACKDVEEAIAATDWPHGSGSFTIYPESGKKRGMGNGVDAIKIPCIQKLIELGWQVESLPPLPAGTLKTGDLDALFVSEIGYIAFEWETGNISSCHRAINKLLQSLMAGGIIGAFLVVPSDKLKTFLTDRIGNIGELRPYFPLWKSIKIRRGVLEIIVVEHDATSIDVPKIPKRTDGRAAN
jgi:hypothetical protein